MLLLETTRSRTPVDRWYDAERSPVSLYDLAPRQTNLPFDEAVAPSSIHGNRGNA